MHPLLRTALKGLHRTAGRMLPPRLLARSYPGVPHRVHVDDLMLRSDSPEQLRIYLDGGLCAVRNIEESLAAAGRTFGDLAACLDLPCGYGRVMRHLSTRITPARLTACDADRQAVRFCASEFGARPLFCHRDPQRTAFPEPYDLIFVGSLLTHLPEAESVTLLEVLVGILKPRGVLVFTTQGESCLENLAWYGGEFAAAEATYREAVRDRGVCFVPYRVKRVASKQSPADLTYGITIQSHPYVESVMSRFRQVTLRRFRERGWERHQDVWAYQRE